MLLGVYEIGLATTFADASGSRGVQLISHTPNHLHSPSTAERSLHRRHTISKGNFRQPFCWGTPRLSALAKLRSGTNHDKCATPKRLKSDNSVRYSPAF